MNKSIRKWQSSTKDKKQQEELAKLREQLKEHQSQQEQAKQAKLAEDAAKGRALMSTMLEHMRDLLGANEEFNSLKTAIDAIDAEQPQEMNQQKSSQGPAKSTRTKKWN